MALSDRRIVEEMAEGAIVISPFNEKNLSTSSYDVTLGEWFYRPVPLTQVHTMPGSNSPALVFNIYNQEQTEHYWVKERAHVVSAREAKLFGKGISEGEEIIMIQPGETILAHTQEFIGGRDHITTMMKARSSMGRQQIAVCKCAGWGDVGYVNRWTLEISNHNQYHAIPLVVGRRIAQLVFFETGMILGKDYAQEGKYQTSHLIEELEANWKPEDMLPKLWKDRDIK